MATDLTRWNYWMWDDKGRYVHKYDHDMSDHPDGEYLRDTNWDEKWTKRLFLTAEEATALSFGRSPDKVPWDDHHSGVKAMDGSSEFATHFCDLRRRVIEAQEGGVLPRVIPAIMYVQWTDANNLPFPPVLADEIKEFYNSVTGPKDQDAAATLEKTTDQRVRTPLTQIHPRQRNNYLRVILAVAKDKYGHPKPGAPKKMSDAMQLQGSPLDEETLRKYLKEAEDLP